MAASDLDYLFRFFKRADRACRQLEDGLYHINAYVP